MGDGGWGIENRRTEEPDLSPCHLVILSGRDGMNSYLIRVLVALVLAAFLVFQARGAAGQPHRRRAFWLGAAALLMLAVYNGTVALSVTPGLLQTALAIAGLALFAGAIVSLVISFSSG